MSNRSRSDSWLTLLVGMLAGGFIVWLLARRSQPPAPVPHPPKPPGPEPPGPGRTSPPFSAESYQTWLDWFISHRRADVAYVTSDLAQHRIWLARLVEWSRLPWLAFAVLGGLGVFLFGLILAATFNFAPLYLRTQAIYLGSIGTGLGLGGVYWVSRAIPPAFAGLGPYFAAEPAAFKDFLAQWFRRIFNNRAILSASAVIIVTSFAAMAAVFLWSDITVPVLRQMAPSLVTLEDEWYFGGANVAKMLIIDLHFLINFASVVTGMWMSVGALLLLDAMASMSILPLPKVVALKLRHVTRIFLVICLIWLAGVAIFTLLFLNARDPLSIIWIGSQAILTVVAYLIPQLLGHRLVLNLQEDLMRAARDAYAYYLRLPEEARKENNRHFELVQQLSKEAEAVPPWTYQGADWPWLLLAEAVPPMTAVVKGWSPQLAEWLSKLLSLGS